MQKSDMEKATDKYIAALQKTEEYLAYADIKERAKEDAILWQQLCDYRRKRYEFQNLTSTEELFDRVDAFERDYREWKKDPRVTAFLEAELAFCRMMQEANLRVVEAMDFE